jgi:hypothetical protein
MAWFKKIATFISMMLDSKSDKKRRPGSILTLLKSYSFETRWQNSRYTKDKLCMSQRNAQPQQPHIVHRPHVMMAFLNSFQLVSASHHGPWVGTEASNIQTKKGWHNLCTYLIICHKVGSRFQGKITNVVFDSLKEMNGSTNPHDLYHHILSFSCVWHHE